jgi:hypothetical protein
MCATILKMRAAETLRGIAGNHGDLIEWEQFSVLARMSRLPAGLALGVVRNTRVFFAITGVIA